MNRVFPTCVGVFLGRGRPRPRRLRSSPRAWGCFYPGQPDVFRLAVFPTCVGVFPLDLFCLVEEKGLPHVRGGVSPSS